MVQAMPIRRVRGFPADGFLQMQREVGRIFDEMQRTGGRGEGGVSWVPAMDLIETAEEIRFILEVAGVSRDDIEITLHRNALRIAGRKTTGEEGEGTVRLRERRQGSFERTVLLPEQADATRISARQENGILTVIVPKTEEAKPRQIVIEDGASGRGIDAA